LNSYIGEIAALTTSLLFSATSTLFTLAGRQVGAVIVNRTRLILAIIFLLTAHFLLKTPAPSDINTQQLFWLSISGIVGLVLGDAFLFQAFIWIGPRLSMLLMALVPAVSTFLAWVFLNETLSPGQLFAIFLTLVGISWVVMRSNQDQNHKYLDKGNYSLGILYGLAAASGQAIGLVTAKQGLGSDLSPLTGTLIRMIAAAITLWGFTFIKREVKTTLNTILKNPNAGKLIMAGAFTGPFLGVTFSLIAIQNTEVGIASTLMALTPIILLPVGYFFFKERFGWDAVLGTILAVIGVGLLLSI
jgi:drug/metabolite transporter (DMT)-like permease